MKNTKKITSGWSWTWVGGEKRQNYKQKKTKKTKKDKNDLGQADGAGV